MLVIRGEYMTESTIEKPSYYAILPANVRYDNRLKPMEKLLYCEITSLLTMNGKCFASNEYFARLYDIEAKTVSGYISHLKKLGYIKTSYEKHGAVVSCRYITVADNAPEVVIQKQDNQNKDTDNNTQESTEPVSTPTDNNTIAESKKNKKKKEPLLNREPENFLESIEKVYLMNYEKLRKDGVVQSEKPVVNWAAARRLLTMAIKNYGEEVVFVAVENSIKDDFVVQKGYSLNTILSTGVLSSLINGNDKTSEPPKLRSIMGRGVDEYVDNGVDF